MKTLFLMTGYGLAALLFLAAYAAVFLSMRGMPVYSFNTRQLAVVVARHGIRPAHQPAVLAAAFRKPRG